MPKNLKDFAKKPLNLNQPHNQKTQQEKTPEAPQKKLEDVINEISQKPQSEIKQQLFEEVAKQKQNGTFDATRLERMVNNLNGLLTEEQKKNIKELINQIK